MRITTADGTRLAVHDTGGTGRPVVLLHAWGLDSHMWNSQIGPLAQTGARVITIDRRGHGRSEVPATGYDLNTLASDVVTAIDEVAGAGVVLIGHSLGGLEAAMVAAGPSSDRVAALVLSASVTPCLLHRPDNPHGLPREIFESGRHMMSADIGAWIIDNTAGYWGDANPARPVETAWTQQRIYSTPLAVLLSTNQAMVDADVRPHLARISCPTLVIHGDSDRSAPLPITGTPTAHLLRHGHLEVVAGAGHGLYTSHAATYNDILHRFIANTTGS